MFNHRPSAAATSQSLFVEYLQSAVMQRQLEQNLKGRFLKGGKRSISGETEICRIFDDFPGDSRFNSLIFMLPKISDSNLDTWIDLTSSIAMHDLFDIEGNILPNVYNALNQDGILEFFEESLTREYNNNEKAQDIIKSNLFSGYMQTMFGLGVSAFPIPEQITVEDPAFIYGTKLTGRCNELKSIDAHIISNIDKRLQTAIDEAAPLPRTLRKSIIKHLAKVHPFVDFLKDLSVVHGDGQLETNLHDYGKEKALMDGLDGEISRCFNHLPPYPGIQLLLDTVEESVINKSMTEWLYSATACALEQLFNAEGNLRTDIYDVLNVKEKGKEKDEGEGKEEGLLDKLIERFGIETVKKQLLSAYILHAGEYASQIVGAIPGSGNGGAGKQDCLPENEVDPSKSPSANFGTAQTEFLGALPPIDKTFIDSVKANNEFYQSYNKLKKAVANESYDADLRRQGADILAAVDKAKPYAPLHELSTTLRRANSAIKHPSKITAAACRKQAKKVAGFPWGDVLGSLMMGLAGAVMVIAGAAITTASIAAIPCSLGISTPFSIVGAAGGVATSAGGVGTLIGSGMLLFQACKEESNLKPLRQSMQKLATNAEEATKRRQPM